MCFLKEIIDINNQLIEAKKDINEEVKELTGVNKQYFTKSDIYEFFNITQYMLTSIKKNKKFPKPILVIGGRAIYSKNSLIAYFEKYPHYTHSKFEEIFYTHNDIEQIFKLTYSQLKYIRLNNKKDFPQKVTEGRSKTPAYYKKDIEKFFKNYHQA